MSKYPELRLGQLIENVYGCVNAGSSTEARPDCVFQLDDPAEIRGRLEAVLERRLTSV